MKFLVGKPIERLGWQTRLQAGPEKTMKEDFFREVDLLKIGYHPRATNANFTQRLAPRIGVSH